MMLEELGLVISDGSPATNGVVTFFAFIFFGAIPLIPYFATAAPNREDKRHHQLSCCLIAVVLLFSLGFAKAMLLDMSAWRKALAGTEALILGVGTIAVGYGIGVAFDVKGH